MSDSGPARPTSPVVPVPLSGSARLKFRCYPGISCFNACCKHADITLTPYDIIRLKNRLGIRSSEFLREYTVPFEMEPQGIAGVKLRTLNDAPQCVFMREEGCSVYEDRPASCRYYPAGLLLMHKADTPGEEESYVLVKEAHCKGHEEDHVQTLDEYRHEQGLEEYDRYSFGWRQLILKKKSAGPAIGKPSERSLRLFFTACYNIDDFREFVISSGFRDVYDLDDAFFERVRTDDLELLEFAYRLLRQVLFGEMTIPTRAKTGSPG